MAVEPQLLSPGFWSTTEEWFRRPRPGSVAGAGQLAGLALVLAGVALTLRAARSGPRAP
jgi:hypothetical protein